MPITSGHDDVGGHMKEVQHPGFRAARTLPPVRRYLAILLLVVLPVQFSWAMVGQYCAHETGAQSQHLGHHSHEHEQNVATAQPNAFNADEASGGALGGVHADCYSCHVSCGFAILTPLVYPEFPSASVRPNGPSHAIGMHLAEQPDRPQWPHSRTPV